MKNPDQLEIKVARLEVRSDGVTNDIVSLKNDIKTSTIMLKEAITDLGNHINATLERHEKEIQDMKSFRTSMEVLFSTWGKVALLGVPILMTFLSLLFQKIIDLIF